MRPQFSRPVAPITSQILVCLALAIALLPWHPAIARAQDEPTVADATVRVVHASPGAPDVDVLLDGQPILQGVPYGEASPYVAIIPAGHRFQIVPTGQTSDAAVFDQTLDAKPGQAYLLAVFGLLNDIGGDIYEVDLSEIEPGNARGRLINLSPDAGAVDIVQTGGDEWFSDVGLGDAADYRHLGPGTYSVDLRGDDERVLKTIADVTFEETRVYDLIVLGQIADDSLEVLSLVTTASPPCAEVLALEGVGGDACLRFVHAGSDASPVDVYLSDAQLAHGLEFGTATEYVAVPSGTGRGIRVVATDAPVEEAMIDTSLDFEPGQAYEILVTGEGENLELTITGTDLRPLAAGQARLRVVHASPDAGAIDVGIEGQEENLYEGVNFRDATNYLVLDAGDYPIQVRPGGDDMTVALQSEATLAEGITYDLIALGRADDQTLTLLALMAPVAIQTGEVATPASDADESTIAETVVPEPLEEAEASPTAAP
jgi:hypothetical protein